ncbi:ER lumen protein-retaining receptor 1-B-like isoform X2 [Zophobas morio]|uniref:ER lumen protein-retaining receptor 1-B-like isoform X2 n=1 Tax=Zophobas morio TaxID=2755281 RepID=UPI0030833B35
MNGYRFSGDMIHLFALVLLLFKLWIYKSAAGISGKMQILLALVFTARYLDLFTNFVSAYNTEMKILYICLVYSTVLLIYTRFRKTYESHLDTLQIGFVIFATLCLALVYNYDFTVVEVFWAFSQYLEAVAAWPQFFMIKKTKQVKTAVFVYLTALGLYRLMYIANWGYRYYLTDRYELLSVVPGGIQVLQFLVFWVLCLTKVVTITSDKMSWFAKNLTQSDTNGIFVIQVPGGFDPKDAKLALIDHCEDADQEVATLTQKQEMPTVHNT